jgi:xylulokinase
VILTVDVGTSLLKAALFDRSGVPVSRAEAPLVLIPHPDPLWHESDARQWVRALRQVVPSLGAAAHGTLDAVVVSGNGPTLVPVDAAGAPLSNAMTWMDRRGQAEAAVISEKCGRHVDPTFYLPKAFWIFRNAPEIYERTRYFFSCPEMVAYALTGVAVTFLPTPQYTRYIWEESQIRGLGMDPSRFPPFIASGQVVGAVSAAGEAASGIPSGVPVVAGAPDFIVSLLGTGTVVPGRACVRSGTSEGINLCSRTETTDRRLLCVSHIAEGLYNISGMISTSGKALEWFKNTTGKADASYESVLADVEEVPPGANRLLFLPYLAGERAPLWDPNARGAFIGLTLNHRRKDMTRAVVESVAYAIRDVIEAMEEARLSVQDLRITGSPARSAVWNQIKADVTGRRILVPATQDSDLAGDACLALYALGDYPTIAAASEAIAKMGAVFEPDPANKAIYDEMFGLYRESYRGLRHVFEGLSRQKEIGASGAAQNGASGAATRSDS